MSFLSPSQREALIEEFNEFVEQLTIIGWKEMRSWSEFMSCFKIPDSKNLEQRVTTNFLHYRTNYLIITASIFIVRILLAPFLFLSIVLCAVVTAAVVLHKEPIRIGDVELNHSMKLTVCAVTSLIFLALCGAVEHLLWGLVFSAIICVAHMVFRPRNISSKGNKVYEEMKIGAAGWFKKEKDDIASTGGGNQSSMDPENPAPSTETSYSGGSIRKRASPQGLY